MLIASRGLGKERQDESAAETTELFQRTNQRDTKGYVPASRTTGYLGKKSEASTQWKEKLPVFPGQPAVANAAMRHHRKLGKDSVVVPANAEVERRYMPYLQGPLALRTVIYRNIIEQPAMRGFIQSSFDHLGTVGHSH